MPLIFKDSILTKSLYPEKIMTLIDIFQITHFSIALTILTEFVIKLIETLDLFIRGLPFSYSES